MRDRATDRAAAVDEGALVHRRANTRTGDLVRTVLIYATLIALCSLTLLPLIWSLAASFTPLNDIFANAVPFSWRAFLPTHATLQAYLDVAGGPFPHALLVTLFVCALTVLGGVAVNSLAGFAFAVFDFPGKRILFAIVLITFLVPFEVLALPLYVIVNTLHFNNSFQALVLPALSNGVVIFLFRQFFLDTPRELLEAARVDGLSWLGIYVRVVVPLSTPVMVSASLVLFLSQWQSFFWPLLVANDQQYQMVQVALSNFQTEHLTRWDQIFAGTTVATMVPVVLILLLQRYYVRTIARTGLID